eukprot:scaffold5904_cov134-Isochrysis_galbana.AAC.4
MAVDCRDSRVASRSPRYACADYKTMKYATGRAARVCTCECELSELIQHRLQAQAQGRPQISLLMRNCRGAAQVQLDSPTRLTNAHRPPTRRQG